MIKLKTSLTEQDYYELDPFDELKNKKEFVTTFKNIKLKGIVYCKECITDDYIDILGNFHKNIRFGYVYKIVFKKRNFKRIRKLIEYQKISIDGKICYVGDVDILPSNEEIKVKYIVYDLESVE